MTPKPSDSEKPESKARTGAEIADSISSIICGCNVPDCPRVRRVAEALESYATEYAAERVREAKREVELAHKIIDGLAECSKHIQEIANEARAEGYKAGQIACAELGHVTREQFKQYAEQVEASAFRAGQIAMRERAAIAYRLGHLDNCKCKRCRGAEHLRYLSVEPGTAIEEKDV